MENVKIQNKKALEKYMQMLYEIREKNLKNSSRNKEKSLLYDIQKECIKEEEQWETK